MRSNTQRRALALMLLLALTAVTVSGCGGSSTAGRLRSRLLSAADLPAGWSSAGTGNSAKLTNTSCLSGLVGNHKGLTYQTAGFVEGKSIPNVAEVLATGTQVGQVWKRVGAALAGCHAATLVLDGAKVHATVHPLAFPRIGHSSSAYAWSFTLGGIRIGFDLVLFQTGRYAGWLSYADLAAPPPSTVNAFAQAALKKAQAGSTGRISADVSIASAPVQTARTALGAVAYREIGNGPPLLLLTGYSGTMESWDPRLVNALAQQHRVITLDNAGIGETAALPATLTIDAMADQTSALIDTLGLRRSDVLGWSMGSMIAQALAVRHPHQVRRLILCASYPGNGTVIRPTRAELDAFESGEEAKVMAELFPADQTAAENTYLAAVSSYPPAPPAPADVVSTQKRAVDGWWNGTDPAGQETGNIAVPTLVADGTVDRLDPVANSHTLANLIRGAKLKLYPDAGHAFLFQDQAIFVSQIESFLHPARRS
jgi:pimeloyl-ACP methyl ester carboxylesterase